jgi:hypothetical protein
LIIGQPQCRFHIQMMNNPFKVETYSNLIQVQNQNKSFKVKLSLDKTEEQRKRFKVSRKSYKWLSLLLNHKDNLDSRQS